MGNTPTGSPRPDVVERRPVNLSDDESVSVMFRWTQGGQRVNLTGSFNNWGPGIPMVRSGQEFYQIVPLPRGAHQFKFVVDDEWKYSTELPMIHDPSGGVNNFVDTAEYEKYEPVSMADPIDLVSNDEFNQDMSEAPTVEPPTIPVLLLKSAVIAVPVAKDLPCTNYVMDPFVVTEKTKPLIPAHSTCMHVYHDAGMTYRSQFGSDSVVWVSSVRYRNKISTQMVISKPKDSSKRPQSGGLARPLTSNAIKVLLAPIASSGPTSSPSTAVLYREHSNTKDLSTFTD